MCASLKMHTRAHTVYVLINFSNSLNDRTLFQQFPCSLNFKTLQILCKKITQLHTVSQNGGSKLNYCYHKVRVSG